MNITEAEKHQCEHEGCNSTDTIQCHLVDWQNVGMDNMEARDLYEWLCAKHATEGGYCWMCGEFWAGCEEFDFNLSHLCPNCKCEVDSDSGDYDPECDFGEVAIP